MLTVDEFFAGREASRQIFDALCQVIEEISPAEMRVTKSQVAFLRGTQSDRRRAFAWAWMPGVYLRRECAPLVLTLGLQRRDSSARWKEIIEPARGRFTHHLELYSAAEIDGEVRAWLQEAWAAAG